jgi:DNA-binding CsgD family transcriptional regulator
MIPEPGPSQEHPQRAGATTILANWLGSLSEYRVMAVLVLGPDARTAGEQREVVAVHPADYRGEAARLAMSLAYGVGWRSSGSPLVAWTNLLLPQSDDDAWIRAWLSRGVQSLVRVDFPVPFSQGFECFMFSGRPLTGRQEAASIAWSAMSIWPTLKDEYVAPRFGLSPRERQILIELAQGLTAKDAAAKVGCTERTVTFHLSNILAKLKVPNKAAAIQRACSLGLL